ncbi:hypothetical protein TVAG_437270 [Trichomonas vaginalis G3]|uniref:Trafficking protein particle complex subunit n=1 Tax=Trichomonas vaginalis (strain ATCC PRA-98 / G3) TaxID=412133 RepID=A2DFH3_TRIV3|nr:Golgi vesicle transport [Trichomonas vaginalis G3]EAY20901.1 hypothetical protein TVAG_437270 [Trichomonas vaginalis G3]KAI5521488.1 Golgi vesicle transport [Trichomonas vaginalis G3]|eukprot:XP_001581887.1 hypothetical protein [Trichomonas vaginalis G3]
MSQSQSVEFSALVYGSFVASLLEMTEDVEEVNKKLDEIGYRIGLRLAHDFGRDDSLERIDTPDKVVGNVIEKKWPSLSHSNKQVQTQVDGKNIILTFPPSIFTQNVQIPELYSGVHFTGMLPGILRGIFEIFHFRVNTTLLEQSEQVGTKVQIEVVEEIPIAVPKTDD